VAEKKQPAGVLVAKEGFAPDGPRVVRKGETFREGHPVTLDRRGRLKTELFKLLTPDHEPEDAIAEGYVAVQPSRRRGPK
jgi:hypothetical protein